MKIDESHIHKLSEIITGDITDTLYRSGPVLVELFNRHCESKDSYAQGFPTRYVYAERKLKELNGTDNLKKLLEEVVDPVLYIDNKSSVQNVVDKINKTIYYDGFELRFSGKRYKVYSLENDIKPDALLKLNDDYLKEQIEKCDNKIKDGDFDGAITNARTIVETIIKHILSNNNQEDDYKGDILDGYKKIRAILKLNPSDPKYPNHIAKMLSGLISVVDGLAEMRNKMSDSHARRQKPEKHHAKLALNSAKTISEFLIESFNKQFK